MLISLQNITFSFGARAILEDASWQIGTGERIGLVGSNGAGKSTLLRLMTGAYSVESGVINKPKDVSLGFFNQDLLSFSTSESILKVGMQSWKQRQRMQTCWTIIAMHCMILKSQADTKWNTELRRCWKGLDFLRQICNVHMTNSVEDGVCACCWQK